MPLKASPKRKSSRFGGAFDPADFPGMKPGTLLSQAWPWIWPLHAPNIGVGSSTKKISDPQDFSTSFLIVSFGLLEDPPVQPGRAESPCAGAVQPRFDEEDR